MFGDQNVQINGIGFNNTVKVESQLDKAISMERKGNGSTKEIAKSLEIPPTEEQEAIKAQWKKIRESRMELKKWEENLTAREQRLQEETNHFEAKRRKKEKKEKGKQDQLEEFARSTNVVIMEKQKEIESLQEVIKNQQKEIKLLKECQPQQTSRNPVVENEYEIEEEILDSMMPTIVENEYETEEEILNSMMITKTTTTPSTLSVKTPRITTTKKITPGKESLKKGEYHNDPNMHNSGTKRKFNESTTPHTTSSSTMKTELKDTGGSSRQGSSDEGKKRKNKSQYQDALIILSDSEEDVSKNHVSSNEQHYNHELNSCPTSNLQNDSEEDNDWSDEDLLSKKRKKRSLPDSSTSFTPNASGASKREYGAAYGKVRANFENQNAFKGRYGFQSQYGKSSSPLSIIGGEKSDSFQNSSTSKKKNYDQSHISPSAQNSLVLHPQQRAVLRAVLEGKNVFFTGKAGTGKSLVLREIIKRANKDCTYITAATGIAAVNIGGSTLHSFAGIGLGHDPTDKLVERIRRSNDTSSRWRGCKVLIIDEISMITAELFDKLCDIAKSIRPSNSLSASKNLFGGIQLIVTGDFFQLPPVMKKSNTPTNGFFPKYKSQYAFDAKNWGKLFPPESTFELTHIYRQKNMQLVRALHEVRMGNVSNETEQLFSRTLARNLPTNLDIKPTILFCTNKDVLHINMENLRRLKGPIQRYQAINTGQEPHLSTLLKNAQAEEELQLKEGAQVMLLKNLDFEQGLVNGSRGVVTHFIDLTKPLSQETNKLIEDSSKLFGTNIKGGNLLFLPVVKFSVGISVVMDRATWKVEQNQKVLASRTQIPLKLAWAITVHKSQGLSIDYVDVNLSQSFESGQIYVALSRARTMEGLKVTGFQKNKVMVSKRALDWYNETFNTGGGGSQKYSKEEHGSEDDWDLSDVWLNQRNYAENIPVILANAMEKKKEAAFEKAKLEADLIRHQV